MVYSLYMPNPDEARRLQQLIRPAMSELAYVDWKVRPYKGGRLFATPNADVASLITAVANLHGLNVRDITATPVPTPAS